MDAIIEENVHIMTDWAAKRTGLIEFDGKAPDGVKRFADRAALEKVKAAKDLACVDVVIVTRLPNGTPAVLLSKRASRDPFGGTWWIYGGSLGSYQPIGVFIAERASRECGVRVEPQVRIGTYRTCAADRIQSTLQVCYAAAVPYEAVERMRTDPNHEAVQLFTVEEMDAIPESERHWYPLRVARLALANMM